MLIADPFVSLTDYGLALECTLIAILALRSGGSRSLAILVALLFSTVGLAALLGGTVHGFLTDRASTSRVLAWRSTVSLLTCTGYLETIIGIRFLAGSRAAKMSAFVLAAPLIAYVIFVSRGHDDFLIAIVAYSAGLLVLAIASLATLRASAHAGPSWLLVGIAISVLASLVQQNIPHTSWSLSMRNAIYHSVEAVALWLMYAGFQQFIRSGEQSQ
jgi:hypothetical protein